ncbi:MAG TPA: TonB family protein [Gemmatimonadales bacterium]|nr:TonB family protein [Gemmatimonadales bacterium]
MYDDLARTQNPAPLEWLVVHAVIPSVLVTAALHWQPAVGAAAPTPPVAIDGFVMVCGYSPPLIPDLFPTLVRMPRPTYPESMRRSGIEGRVVVKAVVNTRGRVYPSSILVLRTTHVQFVAPARQALAAAVFHPARLGRARVEAWITIGIDVKPLEVP